MVMQSIARVLDYVDDERLELDPHSVSELTDAIRWNAKRLERAIKDGRADQARLTAVALAAYAATLAERL